MANNRVGGLWKKTTLNGVEYLNGNIDIDNKKIYIAVFPNDRRTNPKAPDYNIVVSDSNKKQGSGYKPQNQVSENDYDDGRNNSIPV